MYLEDCVVRTPLWIIVVFGGLALSCDYGALDAC